MKTKSFLALTLGATLFMASCQKQPMACFEPSKSTSTVNETITFTANCSMDAHHYEWDFGDGSMSTDMNPTHAYANKGSYTVKLMTMSMNSKKSDETTKTVTVQ